MAEGEWGGGPSQRLHGNRNKRKQTWDLGMHSCDRIITKSSRVRQEKNHTPKKLHW